MSLFNERVIRVAANELRNGKWAASITPGRTIHDDQSFEWAVKRVKMILKTTLKTLDRDELIEMASAAIQLKATEDYVPGFLSDHDANALARAALTGIGLIEDVSHPLTNESCTDKNMET